jgi:hypothetical protein
MKNAVGVALPFARMHRRHWLTTLVSVTTFAGVAGSLSCGALDPDRPDNFNALKGKQAPTVAVATPPASTDAGCANVGSDGGACPVSFKTDLMPIFKANSCTLTSCHNGTYGPKMTDGQPEETWANLAAKVNSTLNKPYIKPCVTDPAASYIVDNLKRTPQGGQAMPQSTNMSDPDIAKVETWVKCGAPNN